MTRPKIDPEKRQRTANACNSCKRRKQKVSYFLQARNPWPSHPSSSSPIRFVNQWLTHYTTSVMDSNRAIPAERGASNVHTSLAITSKTVLLPHDPRRRRGSIKGQMSLVLARLAMRKMPLLVLTCPMILRTTTPMHQVATYRILRVPQGLSAFLQQNKI